MIASELHIQHHICFASAKMHVHFAAAPSFQMENFLFSFFCTSNPLVILRKRYYGNTIEN